jgi:hypothetical protein
MDNECDCWDCFNNEEGICSYTWISLDEKGMCLDKTMAKRSKNDKEK